MLGTIAASALQTAGNIYSAKEAMRKNERAMKNRHYWEVGDLRRAGLNPILSARNSGTPGLPGVQFQMPDIAGQMTNAKQTESNVQKQSAENLLIHEKIKSEGLLQDKTYEETGAIMNQSNLYIAQAKKVWQEKNKIAWENISTEQQQEFLLDKEFLNQAKVISSSLGISLRDFLGVTGIVAAIKGLGKKNITSGKQGRRIQKEFGYSGSGKKTWERIQETFE